MGWDGEWVVDRSRSGPTTRRSPGHFGGNFAGNLVAKGTPPLTVFLSYVIGCPSFLLPPPTFSIPFSLAQIGGRGKKK
jgi:hypothetical protein